MELFSLNTLSNYPFKIFVFTDASWLPNSRIGGSGFYIINAYNRIAIASCSNMIEDNTLEAELITVEQGLKVAADWKINIVFIFTNCLSVKKILNHNTNVDDWRMKQKT